MAVPAAVLALAGCSSAAPTALASGHPRLVLDPGTLATLRARAGRATPQWRALRGACNVLLGEHVVLPGATGPGNALGEGYQGSDYDAAIADLGLCYQLTRYSHPGLASSYAAKGNQVLIAMSAPPGAPGYVTPLRDDGYGIRFYGVGMALGYDWLHDALPASTLARVQTAIQRWITAWQGGTFEYVPSSPNGNYFAGYFAAKGLAAMALDGAAGAQQWRDFYDRIYLRYVRPYYARNLSGGGWSEGWNYGPLATLNMDLALLAMRTARGIDVLRGRHPFAWLRANARYMLETSWPNHITAEDFGVTYEGNDVPVLAPSVLAVQAWVLARTHDRLARALRRLRSDAQRGEGGSATTSPWLEMLFVDPRLRAGSYGAAPLSYLARGLEEVTMRSSWSNAALYADFVGGPSVGFGGSGEELFEKGAVVVTSGSHPLLVNVPAQLMRHLAGTQDAWDNQLYDDQFSDTGARDIYNIVYAGSGPAAQPGYHTRADGNRARIVAYRDAGPWAIARAGGLQGNFPRYGSAADVQDWTRTVLMLRPDLVLVHDQTVVSAASAADLRMSFNLGGVPQATAARSPGVAVYGVQGAGNTGYAGSVAVVLPPGHGETVTNVFGSSKAYRLDVHPSGAARRQSWLTAFMAAGAGPRSVAALSPTPGAEGCVIAGPGRTWAAVFASSDQGALRRPISFRLASGVSTIVTDLPPGARFSLGRAPSSGGVSVSLQPNPGGSLRADGTGTVSFTS